MNAFIRCTPASHARPVRAFAVIPVILAMLVMLFSGCATVGRDFPVTRVSDIEIGKTTQEEVRAMFGSPWRIGIEDGQRTWTYGKYSGGIVGQKRAKDLLIRFDDKGVVVSYSFSTTEHNE